jgi:predicted butyrate kinase (DUF1464 family)
MPRVIGIDPGTLSIDICGLDDGRLFVDRSLPTVEALVTPSVLLDLLEQAGPLDLVAGPSGYGLPLTNARDLTDADLRLAYLAAHGESGGLGGLRSLMRALAGSPFPVVVTPGVMHLPSVPAHRKVNRVDMGTADKLCAVVLAIHQSAARLRCEPRDVSLILLELGGAFTAAVAVEAGRVVDGIGGTSGPMGARASGALDGEVAYLAGSVPKAMLFRGGVADIAGTPDAGPEGLTSSSTAQGRLAWEAYLESAVKAVASLAVSAPRVREVILSGRFAAIEGVAGELRRRIAGVLADVRVRVLTGFAAVASQAAQGAALLADGLAGGASSSLVETLGVREASGSVLDHLHVVSPAAARARLGIA